MPFGAHFDWKFFIALNINWLKDNGREIIVDIFPRINTSVTFLAFDAMRSQ